MAIREAGSWFSDFGLSGLNGVPPGDLWNNQMFIKLEMSDRKQEYFVHFFGIIQVFAEEYK